MYLSWYILVFNVTTGYNIYQPFLFLYLVCSILDLNSNSLIDFLLCTCMWLFVDHLEPNCYLKVYQSDSLPYHNQTDTLVIKKPLQPGTVLWCFDIITRHKSATHKDFYLWFAYILLLWSYLCFQIFYL